MKDPIDYVTREYLKSTVIKIDTEYVILLPMLILSLYMFLTSFSFPTQAATFPRLTTGLVIIGTSILLAAKLLPHEVTNKLSVGKNKTKRDTSLIDAAKDEMGEFEDDVSANSLESSAQRPIPDSVFAGLSIGFYIITGYLIGILWASPLFILVYTLWFRLNWYVVIMLTISGFIIAYLFMIYLVLPLDEGALTGVFNAF